VEVPVEDNTWPLVPDSPKESIMFLVITSGPLVVVVAVTVIVFVLISVADINPPKVATPLKVAVFNIGEVNVWLL
jgi:hypothetical protein